jgi:hypothetical protein
MTDQIPPPLDARTMSDAEFDAAMRAKAWRGQDKQVEAPPPASTKPPPPAPVVLAERSPKPAMAMTDAEFDEALKKKAWR